MDDHTIDLPPGWDDDEPETIDFGEPQPEPPRHLRESFPDIAAVLSPAIYNGKFPELSATALKPSDFPAPFDRLAKIMRTVFESDPTADEIDLLQRLRRERNSEELEAIFHALAGDSILIDHAAARRIRHRAEAARLRKELGQKSEQFQSHAERFAKLREGLENATTADELALIADEANGIVEELREGSHINVADPLARFADCRFNPESEPEKEVPIFSFRGIVIGTAGSIGGIVAQKSAGKSHLTSAFARAALGAANNFELSSHAAGKNVLHLDGEMSGFHYDRQSRKIINGADASRFFSYRIRDKSLRERKEALRTLARATPNIACIILDGLADFVANVNDQEECAAFIAELMALSTRHQAFVLGVLHLNPSSDSKSRGHLGSELERKAETVLQIDKTGESTRHLWTPKARTVEILKSQAVRFEWRDDLHDFATIPGTLADQKRSEKAEKMTFLLRQVIANSDGMLAWAHCDLSTKIEQLEGVSDRTARRHIQAMTAANLLKRCQKTGNYLSTLED